MLAEEFFAVAGAEEEGEAVEVGAEGAAKLPTRACSWLVSQSVMRLSVSASLADDQVRLARQRIGDPLENAAARRRRIRAAAAAGDSVALEAVHAMQALGDEWPLGLPEEYVEATTPQGACQLRPGGEVLIERYVTPIPV